MSNTASARVGILMGSDSDLDTMESCLKTLKELRIFYETNILSAHRTPDRVRDYVSSAQGRGIRVLICAAGGAAHLAGAAAAHSTLPVIGIPLNATTLGGLDALLSTVQMPPGVPVATVGIDRFGATNAAILAAQILALTDSDLAGRLAKYRQDMARSLDDKNTRARQRLQEKGL
jgi:phosphoribosylaminoimidazole carboxylase PurE protein